MNPKVFVSHASEDKDRFVIEFAKRLRERGIDAWVDKWEMLPGDSLVDKIFEEGIKSANGIIVVLSKFSVGKPWVREELNAAFVKKIDHGSKLIPLVIDDCEVPEALKSTVWERIADLSSYESSFDRIVASIYGASDKPPLGTVPQYVQSFVISIGGLNQMDSLVLRLACEEALATGESLIDSEKLFANGKGSIVPESELVDSLEILEKEGFVEVVGLIGVRVCPFRLTTYGFQTYAEACIPDYQEKIKSVAFAIVNEGLTDNEVIRQRLGEKPMMVEHVLNVLKLNGHIETSEFISGFTRIYKVSPSLKRALNGS